MEETLTLTEFKAAYADVIARLADGRLTRVTLTRRGKPVAEVRPPEAVKPLQPGYGALAGSAIIAPGVDLTLPVIDDADIAEMERNMLGFFNKSLPPNVAS